MGNYSELVETQMIDFFCSLNERDRRRYAAIETVKLGHGGIQYISRWKIENEYFLFRSPVPAAKQPQKQTSDYLSQLLGCHRETVAHGITELNSEERLTTDRIRKKGGEEDSNSRIISNPTVTKG